MSIHARSLALFALAIALIGTALSAGIVFSSEDSSSLALGRALEQEIRGHESEPLRQLVADEIEEQRAFGRLIEVWRGDEHVGGSRGYGDIRAPGCVSDSHDRVCVIAGGGGRRITVAAPLRPMYLSILRFGLEISSVSALGFALFFLLGRRVDAAMAREQRFVADAAHELRTPLTRLTGQLELVLLGALDPETKTRVELAKRNCEDLSGTVEALLALSRDTQPTRETVDMGDIAEAAAAGDPRVLVVPVDDALVRGDPWLLRLAVGNLIDNGLKYAGGAVRVELRAGSDVRVLVSDEGEGIDPGEIAAVRQAFVRGAKSAGTRGTGLGLALVDHVARLHGGALDLRAAEPHGLIAEIRLPAWE